MNNSGFTIIDENGQATEEQSLDRLPSGPSFLDRLDQALLAEGCDLHLDPETP